MKRSFLIALSAVSALPNCSNSVDSNDRPANPIVITANNAAVRSFLRGSGSKIVFVNVTNGIRTLCMVDFALDTPRFAEFRDVNNVFMPVLSPDGRYAAYCTNNEGLSGPCKVHLRDLEARSPPSAFAADPAYIPRWWVNPSSGDTCIVYTNSATYNENAAWQSTKTFRQKVQGGTSSGQADLLTGEGSFHDGLSRDGNYLVTGFNRLLVKDIASGEVRHLFTYPGNGKDSLGSTQVCNVSVSPDTGAEVRCLFLDFGCATVSSLTGNSYGVHQYLFLSRLTGSITGMIRVPEGEQSWEYTEWSNRPDYAIACLRNEAGQSHAITIVNLIEGTHLNVVSGVELQHPALLIE